MKKLAILILFSIIPFHFSFANPNAFLLKTTNKTLISEGDCKTRHSPCSTFKIALSVIGFNEDILQDEHHPVWDFKAGYTDFLPVWKQSQTPETWIKNSCVWYSQVLTQKLGEKRFQQYVDEFNYGNKDVSGDPGQKNGLTKAWLSSSLKISVDEQVSFIQKLADFKLPVSKKSQELSKKLLYIETLPSGWKLYGKTGTGTPLKSDGSKDTQLQLGWFVGWLEKDSQKVYVACYLESSSQTNVFGGQQAKQKTKEKLEEFFKNKFKNG